MSLEVPLILLVLFIPLYFLSKWILKLFKVRNRKYIAIIPAIIVSPIVYILFVHLLILSWYYYPDNKFKKTKWDTEIHERYTISKDLIEGQILLGKTKEEVINLLGGDYEMYDDTSIYYLLGTRPGIIIDPDILIIIFKDGKVSEVYQRGT